MKPLKRKIIRKFMNGDLSYSVDHSNINSKDTRKYCRLYFEKYTIVAMSYYDFIALVLHWQDMQQKI